jgi:signal transduction histidine kinase
MITGTVTLCNGWGLVVHDSTGAVWVDTNYVKGKYTPGDQVTVVGHVDPGRYSPQVVAPHIQLIRHGSLPTPEPVSFRQLSSGAEDVQLVSIVGTVRAVSLRRGMPELGGIALSIAMADGRVDAILPSQYENFARALIDANVQIAGTAMARKNDNRQTTGVVLAISDPQAIKVLQRGPSDLFSAPIVPISALMRYRSGTDYFHRVRLRGILTYYEPGSRLVLQDDEQAIEVFLSDRPALQIGDRIEAVGLPSPGDYGPVLQDAVVRQLGHGTPPSPVHVDWHDALSSRYRFRLISIDMRLLRIIDEPARTMLLLEDGGHITTAELRSHVSVLPGFLAPGSTIRVSGINSLTGGIGLIYEGSAFRSNLLLRTVNDASLITPAPWWTSKRLSYLVIALGILALAFLLLLMYVQLKRWKTETILHERESLANDVHDTLAQSFAGIGFQLQVIQKAIAAVDDPNLRHHVDIARKLVQFSHREARRSLAPANLDNSSYTDLLSSLETNARTLVGNGPIEIQAKCIGTIRLVPARLNAQLFHLGQEAIANAIRHAEPTCLAITVAYEGDFVRLTIVDNGCGFTMSGDLLGFGIRGMRKRASEIGGELEITSMPGGGTSVSVTTQLPRRRGIHALFATAQQLTRTLRET